METKFSHFFAYFFEMKKIKLTQEKFAIIDDKDFELISKYKWYACEWHKNSWYALTNVKINGCRRTMSMHRLLLNFPKNQTDHRDGNGLNNRRENLREATNIQNQRNRGAHRRTRSPAR